MATRSQRQSRASRAGMSGSWASSARASSARRRTSSRACPGRVGAQQVSVSAWRRSSDRAGQQLEQSRVRRVRGLPGAISIGSVGTPSRRSVPGVLPEVRASEAMSRMSSASWKATPISSPNSVQRFLDLLGRRRRTGPRSAPTSRSASRSCRPPPTGSAPAGPGPRRARRSRGSGPRPAGRRSGPGSGPPPARGRRAGRTPGRTASHRSGSRPSCPSGRWRVGEPRRSAASSITSSWYSVATWVSSTTTAAWTTSEASGSARTRPPAVPAAAGTACHRHR